MGLSGYLSSGAELGNMTGKAFLSLFGVCIVTLKIEEMVKKALVVAVMLLAAMSARAQIGYKGQVALGLSGGISNVGGFVGTARIGSYLSERSILGAGIILDRTRYDATQGDSFHTSQWLGVMHYQYAIPMGRFIVSPTGGILLGGEQCDHPALRQPVCLRPHVTVRRRVCPRPALGYCTGASHDLSDKDPVR